MGREHMALGRATATAKAALFSGAIKQEHFAGNCFADAFANRAAALCEVDDAVVQEVNLLEANMHLVRWKGLSLFVAATLNT